MYMYINFGLMNTFFNFRILNIQLNLKNKIIFYFIRDTEYGNYRKPILANTC